MEHQIIKLDKIKSRIHNELKDPERPHQPSEFNKDSNITVIGQPTP